MIYEGSTLKQVLIDGGYVTFSGSTPVYHYYLKDHLGNNRVVCSASGTVEQINHYYPFGGLFGESTSGDTQRFKYNGKELDRMHGLDWYDYGARHMDGMRFTTIDPLAEKYYEVSPYAYCANNTIKNIDPNGKEKKSYLSDEETKKSDYNLYPDNTPGVLNIWAHGIKSADTDNYSWSIKVGNHYIENASDLRRFVLSHSKEWTGNQGKNMTIVLHSCSSSNIAKSMSEDKEFKDKNITIIAPNAKLKTNQVGSIVNSKMYFRNDMKDLVRQEKGEWRAYRDGKLINTLPADAQPGMTDKKEQEQILKEGKK